MKRKEFKKGKSFYHRADWSKFDEFCSKFSKKEKLSNRLTRPHWSDVFSRIEVIRHDFKQGKISVADYFRLTYETLDLYYLSMRDSNDVLNDCVIALYDEEKHCVTFISDDNGQD